MNKKVFIWTNVETGLEVFLSVENFPESMHVPLLKEGEEFERPRCSDPKDDFLWYKKASDKLDDLVQRIITKHSNAFGVVLPRDAVLASKMKKALVSSGVEIATYVPGIRFRRDSPVVLFDF
jgi:hypothetical protein